MAGMTGMALTLRAQTDTVKIGVDLSGRKMSFQPLWAYFGYDEPNYTYMKDGRKLLTEIAALSPVPVYVRTHNLLTTGDGTAALKWGSTNAYTEDAAGKPVYDWRITDSIFDTYIKRGMKPIAEIGFMPEALSTHPEPYRHDWKPGMPYDRIYTGWAYPPKDYNKWGELVYQWVRHCVARYGEKEVKSWWWEVWNEPNISYWKGTEEEYFKLYDYAADAVKRACPGARIGGPTSTSPGSARANEFLQHFLLHCSEGKNFVTGKTGAPLDYISFHAKGSPKVTEGHVRMNMATQFNDIYQGFRTVAASAFKKVPIIIGECDPEGCAACSMATSPQNAYRNGTMYSVYTAASYARIYELADSLGVNMEGAVSWSFEFEDQDWFAGFRDLATNGVDKPVLNVFRMFGKMKGARLPVENAGRIPLYVLRTQGVHGTAADIDALAAGGKKEAAVMLWNYHDDDVAAAPANIVLDLKSVPAAKVKVMHYRIDAAHSNSYELWKKMGSPAKPTEEQYKQLEQAGQLQAMGAERVVVVKNGRITLPVVLPRQGVELVKLSW
ncbi:MAG: beta-xylosidase [Bacteroidetes bacterium]|nr:beta-xylosidase [Bacteroidota bacterium]